MTGILDYGMGNLSSVQNALEYLGIKNRIIKDPGSFDNITHLIVPGVGAFAMAMQNIQKAGFVEPIRKFADSGRPLLGICLGMQLLASEGSEPHVCEGLGLIKGRVELMPVQQLRLPHVGWNGLKVHTDHPVLNEVKVSADFYFVHSYVLVPESAGNIVASTHYGTEFPSVVANDRGNVIGIQFHPEKSQKQGLKMIENFSKMPHA